MQKRWGRKISDYGFSEFIKILEYKAREIGSIVQKIDSTIQVANLPCLWYKKS